MAFFFFDFIDQLTDKVILFSIASLFAFTSTKSSRSPVKVRAAKFAINYASHSINFAAISSHSIISIFSVAKLNKSIAFRLSSFKVFYNLY
jgi:hypothetical protein